jgi:hypothetical protein
LAVRAMNVWPLAYHRRHSAMCQGTLPNMPQSGKYNSSHIKISWIWRTCFYIDGCVTLRTVALRRPIFKQKKGYATISLGLNYCSMGSSQPLSCDTVP